MVSYKSFCQDKVFVFHVLEGMKYETLKYIHPLKQREVDSIINNDEIRELSKCVYIFGSATSMYCAYESDIDIGVVLRENTKENRNRFLWALSSLLSSVYDVIFIDGQEEEIYKTIGEKGVKVYEREG
ncbi:MAG: hypothetical protein LBI54_07845 [Lachnospiraceae bacterium]|jgi:predicted nucleotidyltransferase|nr:hypothetical protein [Lachnospiraceae bacterium]